MGYFKKNDRLMKEVVIDFSAVPELLRDSYISKIKRIADRTSAHVEVSGGIVKIIGDDLLQFHFQIKSPGSGISEFQWNSWIDFTPGF